MKKNGTLLVRILPCSPLREREERKEILRVSGEPLHCIMNIVTIKHIFRLNFNRARVCLPGLRDRAGALPLPGDLLRLVPGLSYAVPVFSGSPEGACGPTVVIGPWRQDPASVEHLAKTSRTWRTFYGII